MSKPGAPPPGLAKSRAETKVAYKQLGKSGLRVSVPVLGGASYGQKNFLPWIEDDEEKIMDLLKGAYDRGINTWDTANVYSAGWNEEVIGRSIKKLNIPRHKLIIMTKVSSPVGEEPGVNPHIYPWIVDTKDYVNQSGCSRAALFNSVEACLKRLQTEYIDVLQIHRYDNTVTPEETMCALHDLVVSGKVRYLGASSMWTYQFQRLQHVAEMHGWTKFVVMQNHWSLCYREEEREMVKYCKESGVGLVSWGPLYRGKLSRPLNHEPTIRSELMKSHPAFKDTTDIDDKIVNRVEEIAKKRGWTMSQVALVWLIQKGAVPVTSISTIDRMDEAVGVTGKSLADEEMKQLEELYQPKPIVGHE